MREAGFRQDSGLGQGSRLRYFGHPYTPLETTVTEVMWDFAYCLDNFVFTVLLIPHCAAFDLNSCM